MEFFIGSVVALIGIYFFNKSAVPELLKRPKNIRWSQARLFELTKDLIPVNAPLFGSNKKPTQSFEYEKRNTTRIVYLGGEAWWIDNGKLTNAPLSEGGEIEYDFKKEVDTYTMDSVELDKTIFIVEKLTEGL